MSLNEDGFLSSDMPHRIGQIRQKFKLIFDLVAEVNRFAQQSMFELDAHSGHLQEMLVATLYIRALSTYQAVIILSERGMLPTARILTRAMLETSFSLCAIAKDEQLARDFVLEHEPKRLKFLAKIRTLHGDSPPAEVSKEIEQLTAQVKAEIADKNIKVRSTEQWATAAGLRDLYLSGYAILSDSVHTKVADLERHIVFKDAGGTSRLLWGPDDDGLSDLLVSATENVLLCVACAVSVFGKQKEEPVRAFHDRLRQISNAVD